MAKETSDAEQGGLVDLVRVAGPGRHVWHARREPSEPLQIERATFCGLVLKRATATRPGAWHEVDCAKCCRVGRVPT